MGDKPRDPNREAELAHEIEELKVEVNLHLDAVHVLRNRMQILSLRLSALQRGLGDPGC